ncbi:hypothetical protein RRF89_24580 [Escherichia coli]|uniref:hypothetical protein n=1 Tax=Escherichia coli TaxID=562 RepID=UPI0028DAA4CE|nr:hypothetical protein [Escherichia coli]MDT8480412.1 hypothetical protein [Escherichia coli]MDT8606052.1 hypothetical protein [Escherichia coli]
MAKTKHVLTVEAEIKEAQKKLKQLEDQLGSLSEKAGKGIKVNGGIGGGGFGGISELVGMVNRFAGPQGIAVAAAAATKKFADHIAGLSSELRQASEMSGVGIEELQRLTGVMKKVNLTASEAADIHKDVNEKIYEAVQSGTGEIAGVAKEYKLKFEEISKVMENGGNGIDALAKMYYMLREQGHTANEAASAISRVSDKGGELANQFEKMGSEAEYYKQKASQSINITEEMAKKHAEYEQKTKDLGTAIDGIKVEVFQDLIVGMTDFFNHLYRSLVQYKSDAALTDNFKAPKLTGVAKEQQEKLQQQFHKNSTHKTGLGGSTGNWMGKEQGLSYQEALMLVKMNMDPTKYFKHANNQMYRALQMAREGKNFNNSDARKNFRFTFDGKVYDGNYNQIEIAKKQENDGKGLNSGGGTTCSKCGGKKHEGNEKCPVDLAKEAQQRREKEQKLREDALKKLNDLDVKLQGQTAASITSQNKQLETSLKDLDNAVKLGLISQEDAATKRQQLIDQNAENVYKMVLGADPIDALNALTQLQQIRDNELESHKRLLDGKAISYEEYMRRVNDTEQSYSQIEDSLHGMDGFKSNQLTDSFSYQDPNDPFAAFNSIDQEKREAEQDYQTKKLDINNIKDPKERYKQLENLNTEHQKKMAAIEKQYSDARLGIASDMYDGISGAMALFGAENSKAAKAAFMAHQAYQIGEATVSTYAGAAAQIAKQNYAGAALIVAQGLAQVAKIKSVSVSGMAHDGIDNIPREGTWLLDKGERVVDQRTNGDLKDFLAAQKSGGGNSQPIEVNAPLNINGNVNSSDKMVMDAIKRHAKLVAQAVEDAQRRKM